MYWAFTHYWDCFYCRQPYKPLSETEKQWKQAFIETVQKLSDTIDFIRFNGAQVLTHY